MNHKNIELWNQFKDSVVEMNPNVDRIFLIENLKRFISNIKISRDSHTQTLFNEYLAYFEEFDTNNYVDLPENLVWYSIEDIIDYDIIKNSELNVERPIVKVRDILWELLSFKSNIDCSLCGDDNLRVLSAKNDDILHLCCDLCGNHTNLQGEPITTDVILFPAAYKVIQELRLEPCDY